MCDSEDAQLLAFATFLRVSKLDGALRAHDWVSLARGFNGPDYSYNHYDAKLCSAYQKYAGGAIPDLTWRAAQLYLRFAGFDPGPVDGRPGSLTKTALRQFQQRHDLPPTGMVDDATLSALQPSVQG